MGKNLSKSNIFAALVFFAFFLYCQVPETIPQKKELTFQKIHVQNQIRNYAYYFPNEKPEKILFLLHGGGGSPASMAYFTQMNQYADIYNFGVVYPQGYKNRWNDGRGIPHAETEQLGIDDILYLNSLKTEFTLKYNLYETPFHIAGYSNGGFMVIRYLCESKESFSSYISIAAGISEVISKTCNSPNIKPLLIVWSKNDNLIPFKGGDIIIPQTNIKLGSTLSFQDTLSFFSKKFNCQSMKTYKKGFISQMEVSDIQNCFNGSMIRGISLDYGDHEWPKEANEWIADFINGSW